MLTIRYFVRTDNNSARAATAGMDDRSLKIFKMKKFVLCDLGFSIIYCCICII